MTHYRYIFIFLFGILVLKAQDNPFGKVALCTNNNGILNCYIRSNSIYEFGLDTTSQVRFWRTIINLSPDTGLMNLAANRLMLQKISVKDYNELSDIQKDALRSELRIKYQLPDSERILFSRGRNDFYDVVGAMRTIERGINSFEKYNTDPFYAQAILLIESPNKCARSNVGAYGPFQLMKKVARQLGLKVNKHVDERKDFEKSAWAAAKLIRTICIPYANKMLEEQGLSYQPTDLWYRLFILHVYHAGAGNVAKALRAINPCEGDINLIKNLWQTRVGQFGIASQNYSQVALANLIELDEMVVRLGLVESGI
jgi:hypothetical protein